MIKVPDHDIERLLREGHSNREIARILHTDDRRAAALRHQLGLPVCKPGRRVGLAEAFAARTEEAADGHVIWRGHRGGTGTPLFRYQGRQLSAYRTAFILRTGRQPRGNALPVCGFDQCVALRHVEDAPGRAQLDLLIAVVGGAPE